MGCQNSKTAPLPTLSQHPMDTPPKNGKTIVSLNSVANEALGVKCPKCNEFGECKGQICDHCMGSGIWDPGCLVVKIGFYIF
jgi:hypothetical protein